MAKKKDGLFGRIFGIFSSKPGKKPATKNDLEELKAEIMEAIQSFATRVNAKLDEVNAGVDDIALDIAWLKSEIEKLQNSPGTLTPEDQATLDGIEARLGGTATKATELAAATEVPVTPQP